MAWQIEITRLPRYCDPITVSTWCYGLRRTQAGRNFTITASDGTPYVRADSLWCVFDTEARRPIRIPEGEYVYVEDIARLDMPKTERRLAVEGPGIAADPVTVATHHLDSNGHVNNAQYIAMAADAAAGGLGSLDAPPRRIDVEYRRMALLGDVIVAHVHTTGGTSTVELADAAGDAYAIVRVGYAASTL